MVDGGIEGHGGTHAVTIARQHGVETMFTLSGAHVFPLYDAAVHADPPMPLIDVRHEQSAVFAAEATAKLSRRPGLAVLTAGPGVTNGISAIATAHFNGSPLLVLGGRAPGGRWGSGSLQEIDHPALLAPITKRAATIGTVESIAVEVDAALTLARTAHRGPVFLDVGIDQVYSFATAPQPATVQVRPVAPDPDAIVHVARLLAGAQKPVLVLGSDVWMDRAEEAARRFAQELRIPVIANGMGRGIATSDVLVTRARAEAFKQADLVVVAGAPLDFRLGYGVFGAQPGGTSPQVVHLMDNPKSVARHVACAGAASGGFSLIFDGILDSMAVRPDWTAWLAALCARARLAEEGDEAALCSAADPVQPARIYGELRRMLDDDAVIIGDGGDFVSFAGRFLEPRQPGCWLDPGPYGCLGTGLGYAIAARLQRPSAQVVVLLGDGAAGFSLMDVDTLVRHRLPVVMICGNNGIWGLEKHPMRFLYGYDVAADLAPGTRYDEVVRVLGGDGELVNSPDQIRPALARAFASAVPYLVNIITDPNVAYPRSTTGV